MMRCAELGWDAEKPGRVLPAPHDAGARAAQRYPSIQHLIWSGCGESAGRDYLDRFRVALPLAGASSKIGPDPSLPPPPLAVPNLTTVGVRPRSGEPIPIAGGLLPPAPTGASIDDTALMSHGDRPSLEPLPVKPALKGATDLPPPLGVPLLLRVTRRGRAEPPVMSAVLMSSKFWASELLSETSIPREAAKLGVRTGCTLDVRIPPPPLGNMELDAPGIANTPSASAALRGFECRFGGLASMSDGSAGAAARFFPLPIPGGKSDLAPRLPPLAPLPSSSESSSESSSSSAAAAPAPRRRNLPTARSKSSFRHAVVGVFLVFWNFLIVFSTPQLPYVYSFCSESKMTMPISHPHSTDSSYAFFSSPDFRLPSVIFRFLASSMYLMSIFLRPMAAEPPAGCAPDSLLLVRGLLHVAVRSPPFDSCG
eukprot:CAMPEP_0182921388 /NCGR_PEP_ID=MMETSP0105_2-20130417/4114_1 /TAXON_ID=81532 ORGANISM="Acanthoeca-like sp., Strain 10tr" /NCGR_SAMPLE_ID=MMETSP0105_2 /ASSEMBLY_ACC=CAM_ASM_000205 /LENGTH=424 /DNA_ID=CAMNT_0025058903 /DNA_START=321 /DNA_END=1592 /DNA_ORIENTATION=+